ncbi:hypothetical protein MMC22_004909 [Lobaria immixta]|nr:hypothetical protein [Lobaria immixta]
MAPPHTNQGAKKMKKERRKESRKERKRTQPGFTDKNGAQRTAGMLANRRRQELRKILESEDKMGLTKEGSQQLMSCLAKKTTDQKTSMEDLEPSAAKVMAYLSEKTFDELFASFDARKLGERPKPKAQRSRRREEGGKSGERRGKGGAGG